MKSGNSLRSESIQDIDERRIMMSNKIQINLKANQKQHVMIELNNDSWTEQVYEVGIYHLDEQLSKLDFTMKVEQKEILEIL